MNDASVVGWLLVICGGGLFIGTAWLLMLARSSTGWPCVPGRIVSSERETSAGGARDHATHSLRVTYRYDVGGRSLQGHRFTFGDLIWMATRNKDRIDDLVKRFPPGREVSVYYDPNHPQRCTLVPGTEGLPISTTLVVALLIALAGIAALLGWIKVR